jgi:4-hydroxy-tetrahydrodipicolinate synthase
VKVTGFVPPIATPFRDGRLDLDSLRRMLDDLAPAVSGVLVGGSVGETPSLSFDERVEVMRAAAAHTGKELFLALSISDNSIETSRRLSEVAGECGASVLMVLPPNYFANTRAGLEAYFAAVSAFASADICLYDNPAASHTQLSVDDIAALAAAAPRLTHVKVTDLDVEKVAALREHTTLTVLAGDDAVLWHQLDRGAEGAMVALPMIYPGRTAALWRAWSAGDRQAAYAEYREVARFIHLALGHPDYPAVIKEVLHHRGVIASPEVRVPLVPLAPRRRAEVLAAL